MTSPPTSPADSANKQTVERYIDGFNKSDHEQILSCLTDDIRWTVFGAFRVEGKEAYDANIESPEFDGPPTIEISSLVEENDVVMAELTIESRRKDGSALRAVAGEVFVMTGGLIKERRAYLVPLHENDYK